MSPCPLQTRAGLRRGDRQADLQKEDLNDREQPMDGGVTVTHEQKRTRLNDPVDPNEVTVSVPT